MAEPTEFFRTEIERACAAMRENPQSQWSAIQLAEIADLPRSTFALHFRKITGLTPMVFLRERRMELAVELLKDRQLSIAEIANQIGYDSQSAFHTNFKRWSGASPATYRREILTFT